MEKKPPKNAMVDDIRKKKFQKSQKTGLLCLTAKFK